MVSTLLNCFILFSSSSFIALQAHLPTLCLPSAAALSHPLHPFKTGCPFRSGSGEMVAPGLHRPLADETGGVGCVAFSGEHLLICLQMPFEEDSSMPDAPGGDGLPPWLPRASLPLSGQSHSQTRQPPQGLLLASDISFLQNRREPCLCCSRKPKFLKK